MQIQMIKEQGHGTTGGVRAWVTVAPARTGRRRRGEGRRDFTGDSRVMRSAAAVLSLGLVIRAATSRPADYLANATATESGPAK